MPKSTAHLTPVPVETTPEDTAPVRVISPEALQMLGLDIKRTFDKYKQDRKAAEQIWLRNLRQYLGIYDPDIEKLLPTNRSRAYPRITRVKALSVLARLMNLMFPGNEKNWEVTASPSADISVEEVKAELAKMQGDDEQAGAEARPVSRETVRQAVQNIATRQARELEIEIEDQLQELGGDQTMDYIALVRSVMRSGVLYGPGYLHGPFAQEAETLTWDVDTEGEPVLEIKSTYRPLFEFVTVWDLYPDMQAKTIYDMEGYFIRKVLTRAQLRKLGKREDFFEKQVKAAIKKMSTGNYTPQSHETELRSMGVKENVGDAKGSSGRYEVLIWHGDVSGQKLHEAGADVPEDKRDEDIEAEIWMVDNMIIKADINAWRKLGREVRTIHSFVFDEDDTSIVGTGLPSIMRDSQMSVCAATRMLLDNGSVVCGPNLEVNIDLLRAGQDVTGVAAYKVWEREGTGPESQFPAVRNVAIDSHLNELMQIIDLFMRFADQETFIGPATGGEPQRGSAEPMRTAAGASMLRADASLPFKDVVRNFDTFTQSLIQSMVQFNAVFNTRIPKGDFNVIARGATSLIAKEVRGGQLDQLATTLSPEERLHIDDRKFVEARFAVRDLQGMLVSPDEAERRQAAQAQKAQAAEKMQEDQIQAAVRKTLSEAFKNISQGQKNSATADATAVKAVLDVMERGLTSAGDQRQEGGDQQGAGAVPGIGGAAGGQGLDAFASG